MAMPVQIRAQLCQGGLTYSWPKLNATSVSTTIVEEIFGSQRCGNNFAGERSVIISDSIYTAHGDRRFYTLFIGKKYKSAHLNADSKSFVNPSAALEIKHPSFDDRSLRKTCRKS